MVTINDLAEGMVVLSDVSNRHGNVLLRRGDLLTEKSILLLKSWGVMEVDIRESDEPQVEEGKERVLSPEVIASLESEVRELFPDCADNPFMGKLYAIVNKFKVKSAERQAFEENNETGSD